MVLRCGASQPVVGGLPPWVSVRRMNSTLDMMPEPEVAEALRRSQGMAAGSGEAVFWRTSPLTVLPSFAIQMGPAPWVPMGFPDASVRVASGAWKIHRGPVADC